MIYCVRETLKCNQKHILRNSATSFKIQQYRFSFWYCLASALCLIKECILCPVCTSCHFKIGAVVKCSFLVSAIFHVPVDFYYTLWKGTRLTLWYIFLQIILTKRLSGKIRMYWRHTLSLFPYHQTCRAFCSGHFSSFA